MYKKRIESIDLLRGLIMIIMALDHVRDYFHYDSFFIDPTDLSKTTALLFFTRWITHFCAPLFAFLSGISAFLSGQKKTKKELSSFLLKRGIWLILLENTVMNFGWYFNPSFNFFGPQVLTALGASMICLAALIYLPRKYILIIGMVLVGGHNALDSIHVSDDHFPSYIWGFLHERHRFAFLGIHFVTAYPIIPWIGIMSLGYCMGNVFTEQYGKSARKIFLLATGLGAIAVFILLRLVNLYGDLHPWTSQSSQLFSMLSFVNLTKYPPSLDYLLLTVGVGLIFLAIMEKPLNRFGQILCTYGRVPFFFYVLHIYIIHLGALAAAVITGYRWTDMTRFERMVSGVPWLKGYGFSLGTVYLIWAILVVGLYPLCKWYDQYKMNHKEKWWLSYL
ncbi:MAG: DUF1624 domain-containing protein [Chitinophagales bacterium]